MGIICCSNGKWDENTKYLAGKGNSRLYFLRRLKNLGATQSTLKEVYILFVRSILEMCAPLWTGALNVKCSEMLERVQRSACRIIKPSLDSRSAMDQLNIIPLKQRRLTLATKCAKKMAEDPIFSHLFPLKKGRVTRNKKTYQEPNWKTSRLGLSVIPFFIRILNGEENN